LDFAQNLQKIGLRLGPELSLFVQNIENKTLAKIGSCKIFKTNGIGLRFQIAKPGWMAGRVNLPLLSL
jgi:hypothetical protein